ncbi:sugar O-acyltransferase (sialic acid O-acetyltransferase NeuD family) [Paenibacillus endophyticus]|uniref:Sugar O-acyltransferase (Sialic acid O-acetyltransferase NeuD family) n=1 Tax=Paenibacillus endophyticus TaxID=1294268 RepID=A0A7W5C2Y5_9BACL|nr:acetyltransferase [Paenibacillus endophyticus]MBB3150043.1 sugar O-acyltransferase (sialic acid O-acetyltransferase NeuD family) [Paenibacillus endophyticus]
MKNIIVFGAGGHAKAVIDTIEKTGIYQIVGIIDGLKPSGTSFYGYEILGNEQCLVQHEALASSGIVAIGDNWTRAAVVEKIKNILPRFSFITAVHPNASVARGAQIGSGTVIMAGSVIGSDTRISEHCILYANSVAEHDTRIGNYVTLAPGACTGGNVHIGDYSVVSLGAAIIHGKTIGEHTVIGAGSTVLTDIAAYMVAYGTPAKALRARVQGERYL